jgi:enamine deaminase RidA (YjgF/YER057c/UK114 family)
MTTMQRIHPGPAWYEPHRSSPASKTGALMFVSGQAGIGEHGTTVGPGDFETQAQQAFANLATVLEAAGSDLAHVVMVTMTIMVTDLSHLDEIVALEERYFTEPYPADTLLQVAGPAQPDRLVESEVVAITR